MLRFLTFFQNGGLLRLLTLGVVLLCYLAIEFDASGQCVRIRDRRRNNAWTFTPKKDFRCLAVGQSPLTPFTITFESPVSNVTINWGDTIVFIAGPTTTATRIYKAAGIYNYTITQAGCNQQIKGIFVNDYNTSCPGVGWIAPPNDSARCLPDSLVLRNLSPGMNGFTEWIINWGDQSRDTADYPSFDRTFSHKYKAGTRICNATISISYRNSCNIIPCGQALGVTFGPYRFMERDSALVDNETVFICGPTNVTVKDVSKLNCRDTANRQISWTALDGYNQPLPNPGNGIWRPRGPLKNQSVTIPASMFTVVPPDSTFKLRMRIRNKCGEDTAEMKVRLVSPANPNFSIVNNGACLGTPIQFQNLTSNPFGIVSYVWDYGDGTSDSTNVPNPTHTYTQGGDFLVTLRAITKGFGDQRCERVITKPIYITPAVIPRISILPSANGCGTLTAVIKNKSLSAEGATWRGWEFGGTPLVTAGLNHYPGPISSDPSQVQILNTNPTDSSAIVNFLQHGLYVLRLKGQSPGCNEYGGTDTVRVYPKVKLRWRLSSTNLCQGETFSIRDSSRVMETQERGLGPTYNHLMWTLKLGNDTTVGNASAVITNFDSPSASGRVSHLAFRQAGTFWVKLSVKAGNGCFESDSIQVTVKPSAVPRFAVNRQPCDNSNLVLINQTSGAANRFEYRIYKGNGIVLGQEYQVISRNDAGPQALFLPYAPPGDSTFFFITLTSVTRTGNDSCVITSAPQLIKVAPTPVPGISIQPFSDGCSPLQNINILNTSLNLPQNSPVTFSWQLGSIGSFTGSNPPPVTFVNDGLVNKRDTIRLCVGTGGGCNYCTERIVVTYPVPQAQITIPDSICSGQSVQLAATTLGAVSHLWEFPDYDGSTSNQASFNKVFNNLSGVPKMYRVALIVRSSADCPLRIEKLLRVNPNPDFTVQATTTQDANCGPLHARFFFTSLQNSQRFRWAFSPNDTLHSTSTDTLLKSFSNETASPFQQVVRLRAFSAVGCSTEKQVQFTVNPLVRARFKVSIDSGCSPLRVVLTDSSTVAANVRRWIVNGALQPGQPAQLALTLANNNLTDTIYSIRLAVRNNQGFNCVDTMVKTIKVFPKPRANDLIASPNSGCSPLRVFLKGNVENAVSYYWNFDDGTDTTLTGQEFFRTLYNSHPTNNRIHRLMRISTSAKGCTDTTYRSITVKPQTIAQISALQTAGCTPFTVQFSGLNSVNANAYEWSFGDGSPLSNQASPNYTFFNNSDTTQVFRVRLVARKMQPNSCPDTTYRIITVYPKPQANFTASTNVGCGPLPIRLTNTSTGGQHSYWVVSSGGISDTLYPNGLGWRDTVVDNPNFATKTLRVDQSVFSSFGCRAISSQIIQIYPNLTANFEFDSTGCHPKVVRFKNTSENFQGSYSWDFGDGSSSNQANPIKIFENFTGKDTTYTVTLTSISPVGNCIRTRSAKVRVFATPKASFDFTSPSTIQLPVNTVSVANTSTHFNNWTYQWSFGSQPSYAENAQTFTHSYNLGFEDFTDTIFVVTLVARSPRGCTDTARRNMVVKPGVPVAEFEATPRSGCRPLEVQLTSLSRYASRFEWTYVDKEGSPEISIRDRNPVIFFESAGLKTIRLKVRGLGGRDSIIKTDYIEVFETPRSSFTVDPAPPRTIIAPEEPAYFSPNDSRAEYSYTWYFGDGDSSNARSTQHRYASPGSYDVALKVQSPNGCYSIDTLKGAVLARGEQILAVPTAFTPNPKGSNGGVVGGDGANDVFYPFSQGLSSIVLQIFNRWGQPIFESRELNRGWDGYYRGKIMPADTYVYRIVANFSNGESQTFLGDVTLLR